MRKAIFFCFLATSVNPMAQEATNVYVNAAKPSDVIIELPPSPPDKKNKKRKKEKKLVHFSHAPAQVHEAPVRPQSHKVKIALIAACSSVLTSIVTALVTYKASKCS